MRELAFESGSSHELAREITDAQESGGVNVVFTGADREAMLEFVDQLADFSGLNVHRINVSGLVGERENQTRGNVREAFDNAKESAAILVLDHADEMFNEIAGQSGESDEDALTGIDYLFQRVDAFKGICILLVNGLDNFTEALRHDPQFVVRF